MGGYGPHDGLDVLDRRILAALQMDARASWSQIAEASATSLATVARRAQRLLNNGSVRVGVVPDVNATGPADLFELRIACQAGMHTSVAETLTKREDVRFVSLVTGDVDIIAELVMRKDDAWRARTIGELQTIDGVRALETDLVLHTYKVAHDWSRQIITGEPYAPPTVEPHECEPSHFTSTDLAIVERLRNDGRASLRTVADDLGVNESTVRRRFETLRLRGCVTVIAVVPAAALGFESEILLTVTVDPARLDAAARQLAGFRGVRYLASTLARSSLRCELILPTTQDVFSFMTETLSQLEGVQGWQASMEMLTFKRGFVETPWWPAVVAR